ncbi:hypothetical protein FPRO04_13695 [Fusarium proliferatum]|nr:hypothetical protein FPRO04_13695 [Fusarium proliferatum]
MNGQPDSERSRLLAANTFASTIIQPDTPGHVSEEFPNIIKEFSEEERIEVLKSVVEQYPKATAAQREAKALLPDDKRKEHDRRVADARIKSFKDQLQQTWGGPDWIPADVRARSTLYGRKISNEASGKGIPLANLWAPQGILRRAVKDGCREGKKPCLTITIARRVFEAVQSHGFTASLVTSDGVDAANLEDSTEGDDNIDHDTNSLLPLHTAASTESPKHYGKQAPSTPLYLEASESALDGESIHAKETQQQFENDDTAEVGRGIHPCLPADLSPSPLLGSPDGLLTGSREPTFGKRSPETDSYASPLVFRITEPESKRLSTRSLTASKVYEQLTSEKCMTSDVIELLCQAMQREYGDRAAAPTRIPNPLWFEGIQGGDGLPQVIKNLGDGRRIGFFIHHSAPLHWTLGFAVRHETGFTLHVHDGMPLPERSEETMQRFRALLVKSGVDEQVELVQAPCPRQTDGWSCGIRALSCLRRAIQGQQCANKINPRDEQTNLMSLLLRVDPSHFSPSDVSVVSEFQAGYKTKAKKQQKEEDGDENKNTEVSTLNCDRSSLIHDCPYEGKLATLTTLELDQWVKEAGARLKRATDAASEAGKEFLILQTQQAAWTAQGFLDAVGHCLDSFDVVAPDLSRDVTSARDRSSLAQQELERSEMQLIRLQNLCKAKKTYDDLVERRRELARVSELHSSLMDQAKKENWFAFLGVETQELI